MPSPSASQAGRPRLSEFLEETGLDLVDVYKSGCWSGLQREPAWPCRRRAHTRNDLGDALDRLLHIDDPLAPGRRIAQWLQRRGRRPTRLITALRSHAVDRQARRDARGSRARDSRRIRRSSHELRELLDLLEERADHLTYPLELSGRRPACRFTRGIRWSRSSRRSARITPGQFYQHREGVYHDEPTNTDLFFVTLEKSERDYSPSTLYKDYAISPTLFHWESQSTTTQQSPTGQRYIHHRELGGHILLFVRAPQEAGRPHGAVHVPRPGGLRVAQGRAADRVRLEAAAADAGGFLQGRRRWRAA